MKKKMALSSIEKIICIVILSNFKTGDFYCLNYLHFFKTERKRKSHEKVCKNKDFCGIVMPSEKDDILEFN